MVVRVKQTAKNVGLKVLGWILLVAGIILLPAPGPGAMVILLAMFVLSTQYEWADRRLELVKVWALKGAADSVATWPRILLSLLGVVWLIGLGVVWGMSPPAPDWWPISSSLWLYGGWGVGGTMIVSAVVALGLIIYSFVKLRGRDFSERKRQLDREQATLES
jgi:hypothetical protein